MNHFQMLSVLQLELMRLRIMIQKLEESTIDETATNVDDGEKFGTE